MKNQPAYLIVGSGKVAKHFAHYFTLKQIPFNAWSRKSGTTSELQTLALQSDVILLLITDSAIDPFIENNSFLKEKKLVHFSGALSTQKAYGAHPLMTFSNSLYDLDTYEKIPFVVDLPSQFIRIFPQLKNPNYEIEASKKPLYHALCVLSGNFTVLLWQKAFQAFQNQLALPPQILKPYLEQVSKNIISNPEESLTGPLARRDVLTLRKNLDALKNDPFQKVYKSFIESVAPEITKELL